MFQKFIVHFFFFFLFYLLQICSFLSVWLVVLFTVERFIAVRYPLHRPAVCTVARAKLFICCLTTIALPIYSPYFVIAAPQQIRNTSNNEYVYKFFFVCFTLMQFLGEDHNNYVQSINIRLPYLVLQNNNNNKFFSHTTLVLPLQFMKEVTSMV